MISRQTPLRDEAAIPINTCRWAADRFYWAVLDAPLRRPGQLAPALLLDLQDQVPIDVEQLHAVGIPLKAGRTSQAGRTLVCAAPRDAIRELPVSSTRLTPSEAPAGFKYVVDLHALNLLVGDFEPLARRRHRARGHVTGMVGLVAIAFLISWGFSRRTAAVNRELAVHADPAFDRVLSQADVALLRAFATRASTEPVPADAAVPLVGMLRCWPSAGNGPAADVQSLTVDSRRVALTVSVGADPGDFLAVVRPPPGYVLEQPGIGTTSEGKARLALTFRRSDGGPRP